MQQGDHVSEVGVVRSVDFVKEVADFVLHYIPVWVYTLLVELKEHLTFCNLAILVDTQFVFVEPILIKGRHIVEEDLVEGRVGLVFEADEFKVLDDALQLFPVL